MQHEPSAKKAVTLWARILLEAIESGPLDPDAKRHFAALFGDEETEDANEEQIQSRTAFINEVISAATKLVSIQSTEEITNAQIIFATDLFAMLHGVFLSTGHEKNTYCLSCIARAAQHSANAISMGFQDAATREDKPDN